MACEVCGGGYSGAMWDGIHDVCVWADDCYAAEVGAIELTFLVEIGSDPPNSYVYVTRHLSPCPTKKTPANITSVFTGYPAGYYEASLSNYYLDGSGWMCMGEGSHVHVMNCGSVPTDTKIEITSDPTDATVALDTIDNIIGNTPIPPTEVPSGNHSLYVTKDGYTSKTDYVFAVQDTITLKHVQLFKAAKCAIYGNKQPCAFNRSYFSTKCDFATEIPPGPDPENCAIHVSVY